MASKGLSGPQATIIAAVVGLIGGWGAKFIEQWLKDAPPTTVVAPQTDPAPPAAAVSGFGAWASLQ
jgi:hypothetical protein